MLAELRSTDAANAIAEALAKDPHHPDLLCEKAMLGLFSQREAEAVGMLEQARGGVRFSQLERQLAEHFYCLRQQGAAITPEQQALINRVPIDSTLIGTKVSACLIVKNEQKHLQRCLESLDRIADEIVVVDTGSTDRTVEIAESFGAKMGYFEWCNDFSAARNIALDLATGNWILWIDADEALTPESVNAFRQARVRPQFGGYNIEIENFVDERDQGNTFIHCPIRLFRRHPGIRFTGSIHEQVSPAIEALGLPWARLDGAKILHYGYRPSEVAEKGKEERTISMIEAALEKNPEDGFQWFNLSNAFTIACRFDDAIRTARLALKYAPPESQYIELTYQILAISLSAKMHLDEAIQACDDATAAGFGGILIEFERAQILMKFGKHEEALVAIDRCFEYEWKQGQSGDRGIATHKRHVVRGQILALLGRHAEAMDRFDYALSVDPEYAPCVYCKAATLEKLGRLEEAAKTFAQAAKDPSTRLAAIKAEARVRASMGDLNTAAMRYRQAWEMNPTDIDCWIGWCDAASAIGDAAGLLAAYESYGQTHAPTPSVLLNWGRALVDAGEFDRALNLFSEAIQRDPTNANAYFNCGDLLYRLGNHHDAAHLYENGLRHDPNNAEAWFTLGNSLAQIGITEGAITSYQQTLRINPTHVSAKHNLTLVAA
jgi:tetratricopeptide (TPR) repeat protein